MRPRDRVVLVLATPAGSAARATLRREAERLGFHRFAHLEGSALRSEGERRRLSVHPVADRAGLERLLRGRRGGPFAIRWTGDRVIPLELAVARRDATRPLAVLADAPEEVPAALGALEHGADTVYVEVADASELGRLDGLLDRHAVGPLRWVGFEVTRVEPIGSGDRVLVDTVQLLGPEEGLLVGSAAEHLFGVASEAVGSGFSGPRPFRVNAGAAHSYVLRPDGRTRYLSELEAGEPVLVAGPGSEPHAVRIGRLKIERRPLLLVEGRRAGRPATIFLQEAETVRLFTARGRVPVTSLKPRERILGVALPPARHLGEVVEERVEER